MGKSSALGILLTAASALIGAYAQETLIPAERAVPPAALPADADVDAPVPEPSPATAPTMNPDKMADHLNAQQQIKQSFTFTRTINGEVVETDKRTVVFSRNDPIFPTEGGDSAIERLKAAFDSEVLTRTSAFEEAKLDFVIADLDRDGIMTAEEFAHLAATWRGNDARDASAALDEETARQRQYQAFIHELDPEGAEADIRENAMKKFAFMAGARQGLSRTDYLREYLLDFDTMDADDNGLLKSDELLRFRAINRGETVVMSWN